jgi:tRNA A37 threonylcarbamoyladenosine dehydratase
MVDFGNMERLIDGRFDYLIDCIDGFKQKAALIAHCRRQRIPLISVGGAGGRIDPGRIQQTDLSRSRDDPLLAKVRRLLRREYGFPMNPKRRFEVPALWSDEPPRLPANSSCTSGDLNCAGFGSSMPVTATFALHAAAFALRKLAEKQTCTTFP